VLLFEGAWNLEQRELLRNWLPIVLLAGPGLGISVVVVGLILHFAVGLAWSVAFLLGAIIWAVLSVVAGRALVIYL
jgi:NhaP-type Na+/H+ or K+/H+ antiporter